MQDGEFQMQPSLFPSKSNKGRQNLIFFVTKDCKNVILTIVRRNVTLYIQYFNNMCRIELSADCQILKN